MGVYAESFARNIGLLTVGQQERLRRSRVAVAGCGGGGGGYAAAMARAGVGAFTLADPDVFELVNVNRQYGATADTIGSPKADVMADVVRSINPEAEVTAMTEAVDEQNVGRFLAGADVVLDGIDFFAPDARRLVYRHARRLGIPVIVGGPIGWSAAWQVFPPRRPQPGGLLRVPPGHGRRGGPHPLRRRDHAARHPPPLPAAGQRRLLRQGRALPRTGPLHGPRHRGLRGGEPADRRPTGEGRPLVLPVRRPHPHVRPPAGCAAATATRCNASRSATWSTSSSADDANAARPQRTRDGRRGGRRCRAGLSTADGTGRPAPCVTGAQPCGTTAPVTSRPPSRTA